MWALVLALLSIIRSGNCCQIILTYIVSCENKKPTSFN